MLLPTGVSNVSPFLCVCELRLKYFDLSILFACWQLCQDNRKGFLGFLGC